MENKFRGKAKMSIEELDARHFKHNDGWVIGNLIVNGNTPFIVGDILESDPEYIIHDFWLPVNPETIGQYFGLKDKNGVEIYDKDITELEVDGTIRRFLVSKKTVIREVASHPSFTDEIAKVAITGIVFEWNGFELFPCVDENGKSDIEDMVVIGNIYDNPELLNQDNEF